MTYGQIADEANRLEEFKDAMIELKKISIRKLLMAQQLKERQIRIMMR